MRADWNQIRREYVTTGASYRDLAKKYGVSVGMIAKKSKSEKWIEKREQYVYKVDTKVEQKAQDIKIDQTARLYEATNKLLDKVFQLLDLEDALAPRDLKSLSSTLMDIKMITGVKTDAEKAAEQPAAGEDNTILIMGMSNEEVAEVLA